MTLADLLGSIAYKLSPRLTQSWQDQRGLQRSALELRTQLASQSQLGAKVEAVINSRSFRPVQHTSELLRLLERLAQDPPMAICEIGGANGGTLAAFCQVAAPDALLVSIDISYTDARRKALRCLARHRQEVHCLAADSHARTTLSGVSRLLRGRALDFLMIDGDHSYEGVAQDYRWFSPLVRPGGLIALHDIIPDHGQRFGIESQSVVGGVPAFWQELRAESEEAFEIVEDTGQDGYGLGLVSVPGEPELAVR